MPSNNGSEKPPNRGQLARLARCDLYRLAPRSAPAKNLAGSFTLGDYIVNNVYTVNK